ncbi:MAG: hypothetical protein AAF573_10425 [Bacteroidota bacterium]
MQDTTNDPFLEKVSDPVNQAGIVLVCTIFIMIITKMATWMGIAEFRDYIPWVIAASFLLFYAVFNALFSLSTDDMNKYWIRSMVSYSVLAIALGLLAYLASSVGFSEAGTIRWIFIVLTFVYLVFLSIVNFMKKIVAFAESEEWTAPKKRRKK